MSTRRSFLQSAVLLPSALAAHAFAQDAPAPASPVNFADFESGFGDWTTEGIAFGDAPTTSAAFSGKIHGFGGRGFACSLHKTKGNAATGKLISREFTIEKPFLTFKIGGGNYPGQACLNLVVDNQIARTATGDGTATLSDASWDVSALLGKKAHLEIVDATTATDRGYIMVDDITFTDGGSPSEGGGYIQVPNIEAYRFYSQSVFANKNIANAFGTTNKLLDQMEYEIWQRCLTPDLQYNPGESIELLSSRLKNVAMSLRGVVANKSAFQYACAYTISVWVKSHMRYVDKGDGISHTGTDTEGKVVNFEKRYTWISIPKLLQCSSLEGACRHSAALIKSLSKKAGLSCFYASGCTRGFVMHELEKQGNIKSGSARGWNLTNHAWNLFEFDNGLILPTDATGSSLSLTQWTNLLRLYYPNNAIEVFPRCPLALDLFLSGHYADGRNATGFAMEDASGIATHPKTDGKLVRERQDELQKLSFDDWIKTDAQYTTAARANLMKSLRRR